MSSQPLDWIQEVEASIIALDEKPQFTLPAPLDWGKLERGLRELLQKPELKLKSTSKGWVMSNKLLEALDVGHITLAVEWQPLQTPAFFVLSEQTAKELMALLFLSEESGHYFYESSYCQAFIYYFATQILRLLEEQKFASPLTPRLDARGDDIQAIMEGKAFFEIDIELSLEAKNFWGKIILSPHFRNEWKSYFGSVPPPHLSHEMQEKLSVEIALEIGHSRLKAKEWMGVKVGDLVILDHCSYDPVEHTGAVVLTLQQKPIFRGRLKDEGIKLTSYPIYEEVSDAMVDDDEDFDEELFDEDLDTEDEDSEFEVEEEEEEKEQQEEETPPGEKSAISIDDLPVHLKVEIGRLKMTAAALMNLSPGNLLELNVTVQQGVDLVVNGKKVGRGELIRMGDVLGVRILSL